MPRRMLYGAALAVLLIACDHEQPFETPDTGVDAPFQPGAPVRLTYNPGKDLAPAWLADGSGIIYAWEELAVLPNDRCLGVMAPTGGTRYENICDRSAAGRDSADLFDEPSASSEGQLAFLRGRSRPGAVTTDNLGLQVGVLEDLPTARQLRSIPYTAPSGRLHNRISHIGWLTPTQLVYLGEFVAYPRPCSGCPPDTLISGLEIVQLDFSTATPVLQVVGGTDYASSVVVAGPDQIYFTLGGDTRVYRRTLSTGAVDIAHDFGALGIARDVAVRNDQLIAVVGGRVDFVVHPIFGPVQFDAGGRLVSVDLTSGSETILPADAPLFFRRPSFAGGGVPARLVAEGYPLTITQVAGVTDTTVGRIPDLYLFEAP
jgi:hypothetical protein